MATINLTSDNFEQEIAAAKLAVVDFWASWCGPCKMQSPIIEELSEEVSDVRFCKVNVDEQGALSGQYKIRSIPTIIFFKDGKQVELSVGLKGKDELLAIIGRYR